jgi:hypothetical protein
MPKVVLSECNFPADATDEADTSGLSVLIRRIRANRLGSYLKNRRIELRRIFQTAAVEATHEGM